MRRDVACLPACTDDEQGSPQPMPTLQVGREAIAGWPVTDTLRVPADWVSGYYIAQLVLTSGPNAGKGYQTYFVVREQHRLMIDSGHDEYWTRTMFDAFAQARDAGTNLALWARTTRETIVRPPIPWRTRR